MNKKNEKAQSMVEFALLLPFVLFIVMGVIAMGVFIVDVSMANSSASDAAHEAAIMFADGSGLTCQDHALAAFGPKKYFYVDPDSVVLNVYPCSDDPNIAGIPGQIVTATVDYHFYGNFAFFIIDRDVHVESYDRFR